MIFPAQSLRRALRRDLVALYVVVATADIVLGLMLPLFPLIAQRLGASLALIGLLGAINGGVQVLSGVPIGMLADRWGRGALIVIGTGLLVLTVALLAWAAAPLWLVPAQVALGLGIVATFIMGSALASGLSTPDERGTVMGLYTTAMGTGFALGPLLGGLLAEYQSIQTSLYAAGAVALSAFGVALLALPRRAPRSAVRQPRARTVWNRALLRACVAAFLFSPIFGAVISVFVPLQGEALGLGVLAISSLFTMRALASTAARLPTGLLSTPARSWRLMLAALGLGGAAVLALALLPSYGTLVGALIAEGVSYGVFLTAGQAFVSYHVEPRTLGAALGSYNTAAGVSATISPLLLGLVAQQFGLPVVFGVVGTLVLLGAGVLAVLGRE